MPAPAPVREDAPPAPEPKKARWQALTALSIGRTPTDREKSADVVEAGGIVELTEEQAHGFLTRHRIPLIRPAAEQNKPLPRVTARDLFGRAPAAEAFGARPDPAGASRVIVAEELHPQDPSLAPEANDPQPDVTVDPDVVRDRRRG